MMRLNKLEGGRRPWPVLLCLSWAAAAPALAADLSVRVQDSLGQPLLDASVCAGTPVDGRQFGAVYTDDQGRARFDHLPSTELRVTVSKSGFRGEAMPLSGVRFDRTLIVTLAEGGLGPQCEPPPRADSLTDGGLRVSRLRVDGISGADYPPAVVLDYELFGEANEYRISERQDFSGTEWQPLQARPSHRLSAGPGTKTLYFQVRRHTALADGELSIVSNVANVDVSLSTR